MGLVLSLILPLWGKNSAPQNIYSSTRMSRYLCFRGFIFFSLILICAGDSWEHRAGCWDCRCYSCSTAKVYSCLWERKRERLYSVSQECFESWHFFKVSWKFMQHLETAKDPFRSQKKKFKKKVWLYNIMNTMTCRSTHTNLTESVTSVTTGYLPLAELGIMLYPSFYSMQ